MKTTKRIFAVLIAITMLVMSIPAVSAITEQTINTSTLQSAAIESSIESSASLTSSLLDITPTLPPTGGTGTLMLTIGGVSLIVIGGILLLILLKKK